MNYVFLVVVTMEIIHYHKYFRENGMFCVPDFIPKTYKQFAKQYLEIMKYYSCHDNSWFFTPSLYMNIYCIIQIVP